MTTVSYRSARSRSWTLPRMLAALVLGVAAVTWEPVTRAHETYDISGEIVSLSPTVLEVRTRDRELAALIIELDTRVTRDKKTVPLTDLAVGMEVSVHAIGHTLKDASAREVVIVTPRSKRR